MEMEIHSMMIVEEGGSKGGRNAQMHPGVSLGLCEG